MARSFDPVQQADVPSQDGSSYPRLVALVQRLLAPDGCPWDREQDFASLRRYVLEEAAEVVDAIDRGDLDDLCLELGDLLYQVVFLGELARAAGRFGPDDVVAGIVDKLVRRHPHVFGDAVADGASDVRRQWEQIKATERHGQGEREGVLAGLPAALSPLARAQRLGERAARVGFDWPDVDGVWAKVREELGELREAAQARDEGGDPSAVTAELGDVLFAVGNLARHLGVDAEGALRDANRKFTDRFATVERLVSHHEGGWPRAPERIDPDTLERYWKEAKQRSGPRD